VYLELGAIRRELMQALDVLRLEREGEDGHYTERARAEATDHVRSALLLLTGSTRENIHGHRRGSVHTQDAN
jgi:hypothetical protein